MKPIKKRWHMWKHYTSTWNKTFHAALLAINVPTITVSSINPSVASWTNTIIFGLFTLAVIMWDTWRETYLKTETLRSLGAHTAEALHTYTFVKMAKVRGAYSIEPDLPAIDPDAIDDDIYTDEIVIRRGMSTDGEPLIASSIPEELSPEIVIGMLEHAKLEYTYDSLGNPYE